MKRCDLSIWIMVFLTLALSACVKTVHRFPPTDTTVRLDSTNLPIVWIEINDTLSRINRIGARMKIIHNGDGLINYADTVAHPGQYVDYQGFIALRYRGNSTFNNSPKKPYSFRTLSQPLHRGNNKRKVSILGMGKDNNWALMAPYADKSMMRDQLTYALAAPWLEFVPEGHYCEVIINGVYYGVYVLTEIVSKGKHRLNLDSPDNRGDYVTGDYMLEVDCNDEVTYTSKFPPVSTDGTPFNDCHILFQFKFPDYEDLTSPQLRFITHRIYEMEQLLWNGDYSRYIDIATFIDYQLFTELSHNVDGYRLSAKFYKRRDGIDPRFKMTIWDFDLAYGNAEHHEGWRTDTWIYQSNDLLHREQDPYLVPFWWHRLNNDPNYVAQLKARWAQLRAAGLNEEVITATIDSYVALLTSHGALQRDSQAWPRWGIKVWPNHYVATDFDDEIAYLKQWIHDRIAWMDAQLCLPNGTSQVHYHQ